MAECSFSQLILVVSNLIKTLRKNIPNDNITRARLELFLKYQLKGACECLMRFRKLLCLPVGGLVKQ